MSTQPVIPEPQPSEAEESLEPVVEENGGK